tara:strand:+ start:184 stop:600 length:417 start_codon:yes stop_codon:yes gene_type:complete
MSRRHRISPTRFADEIFTPGSNNKYTKGRDLTLRNQIENNRIKIKKHKETTKKNMDETLEIMVIGMLTLWALTLGLSMIIMMYSVKLKMPMDYINNIICFIVFTFVSYLLVFLIKFVYISGNMTSPHCDDEFYADMYL